MNKTWLIATSTALTLAIASGSAYAAGATVTTMDSIQYSNNGQTVTPGVSALNIDDSLYLPVRALAEAMNKYVDWDAFRGSVAFTDKPQLTGTYKLDAPDLAEGIKTGIGSSLVHLPGDPDNVFYSTADRGPTEQIDVDGETRRTFPLQSYIPTIYKLELTDGKINILEEIPLNVNGINPTTGNAYITGLPNIEGRDEVPYDATAQELLAYDPYGVDIEGIAYNPQDDTFWLADEYGPSLVHVNRDGTIIERIVPEGWGAQVETPLVPAREVLPAVYNQLRQNRGAEAVSITPDGKYMFMAMQNALRNPDKTTDNSRSIRIIKINLETLESVAEYVYITEDASQFEDLKQQDIVISDMIAVNEHTLLIDERDKLAGDEAQLKRIYAVDLANATNILGKYDDTKLTGKTLEQMSVTELKANNILPPSKRTVLDAVEFEYPYEKIEGISLVNGNTLVIVNDNDFGADSTSSENGTELWTFQLPYTLK